MYIHVPTCARSHHPMQVAAGRPRRLFNSAGPECPVSFFYLSPSVDTNPCGPKLGHTSINMQCSQIISGGHSLFEKSATDGSHVDTVNEFGIAGNGQGMDEI